MAVLFKQTTGLFLAVIFSGYKILEIKQKGDFGKFINTLFVRILGILIPIFAFAIYLTYNNIWTEFIDYTILGVKTFSNSISYFTLFKNSNIIIRILSYVVPAYFAITVIIYIALVINKKIRNKTWIGNFQVLLVYSVASLPAMYPIADGGHFGIGSMCSIIASVYLINTLANHIINNKKVRYAISNFFKAVAFLLVIIYVGYAVNLLKSEINIKELSNGKSLEHFKMIPTDEGHYLRVTSIDSYILSEKEKGNKVYILDAISAMFTIPINEYHKNYDMFNIGNFGGRGEEGIIQDLENEKNIIILILKDDYNLNWQCPKKVIKYVKEELIHVAEIGIFDVYIKDGLQKG